MDESQFFADFDGDGVSQCEPLLAGPLSVRGASATGCNRSSALRSIYNSLNSAGCGLRGGECLAERSISPGWAGSTRYARVRGNAAQYFPLGSGFIGSLSVEGGYI